MRRQSLQTAPERGYRGFPHLVPTAVEGDGPSRPALARVGWGAMPMGNLWWLGLHFILCSWFLSSTKNSKVCIVVLEAHGLVTRLSFNRNCVPLTPRGREKLTSMLLPPVFADVFPCVPFWRTPVGAHLGWGALLVMLAGPPEASSASV